MARMRKFTAYLLMVLFLAAFGFELFRLQIVDSISVLQDGVGTERYLQVMEQEDGTICAVADSEDGLVLVTGTQQGKRTRRKVFSTDGLPENWYLAGFYPSGTQLYVSLYELDARGGVAALCLYRMDASSGETALLLYEPCAGTYRSQQMASARLSEITVTGDTLSFVLMKDGQAQIYQMLQGESGLLEADALAAGQNDTVCVLTDGRLAAAGDGVLSINGEPYSRPGQAFCAIRQAGAGLYTVDAVGLQLTYTELTSPERYQPVLSMEKKEYDFNGLTDLAVTGDGGLLLLLEDGRLLLDHGSVVSELSGMLYATPAHCGLVLGGFVLGVLLAAFVLWLIFCQWKGLQISLAVRWGVLALALAVLGVNFILRYHLQPEMERQALSRGYELAAAVTDLTESGRNLPHRMASAVAADDSTLTADVTVTVYTRDENQFWRVQESTSGVPSGIRAELTDSFDRSTALQALQEGQARTTVLRNGERRLLFYCMDGNRLIAVEQGSAQLLEAGAAAFDGAEKSVWVVAGALVVLMLIICGAVVYRLRQVSDGIEQLRSGAGEVYIPIHTGDELEELASGVNTLAHTIRELEKAQSDQVSAYRRFVPENLLALLEKERLEDVDKSTCISRRMATMMVWFQFPQEVYETGGQQLFDHLNEIIERTTPIIAQNGGTVFNFAYNGYDAVFDGDLPGAISTAVAVQQEILAINREREQDGRPRVKLHISLDVGSILMGVVGDKNQLEPVAVSSSFSVAKRLIELCGELEAGILCTESVAACAQGYGSRYMGKCTVGGKQIRTYEIYDGDPFMVRRVKEETAKRFSEGVYLLYSRDFSGAKRIFLDLVHHNTGDGGARYYLYLAHELEKDQEQEISLDYRM